MGLSPTAAGHRHNHHVARGGGDTPTWLEPVSDKEFTTANNADTVTSDLQKSLQ